MSWRVATKMHQFTDSRRPIELNTRAKTRFFACLAPQKKVAVLDAKIDSAIQPKTDSAIQPKRFSQARAS